MKSSLLLLAAAINFSATGAGELFVKRDAPDGGDGSAERPYNSIQAAVDAAEEGAVVKVLPGVYDNGGKNDGYMQSRVVLSRCITLEATGSKEETHIVGGRSSSADGYGADAVRCIFAGSTGSTVKGFTIRNGSVLNAEDTPAGSGGGVCGLNGDKTSVWVVDSVISNCAAARGAAVRYATVVRSLVVGNERRGLGNGAAGRDAAFYNCIVTGNRSYSQPLLHNCNIVNCTVFGNESGSLWEGAYVRNSLFFANTASTAGIKDVRNTVIDVFTSVAAEGQEWRDNHAGVDRHQVISPAFEDVRPIEGAAAATAGTAESMRIYGATVKEEYLRFDFFGNPIPESGTIAAGAVQTIAPAPVSGGITFVGVGSFKVYGQPGIVDGLWAHPEAYPSQIRIPASRVAGEHIFSYWIGSNEGANWRAPQMDDSFYVVPPSRPGEFLNVGVRIASADWVRYVSRSGNDNNDGKTPASAFRTLQKAADAINGSYVNSVVYCGEGEYGETDGSVVAGGHNTRLAVTTASKFYIRFKGAGKGKSVIVGKADASGGCGAGACRGVYFASPCILQGFSVSNCYAAAEGDDTAKGGAGILATGNAQIADCRFENCVGDKGAIGFYGAYMRCEFRNGYATTACFRGARFFTACSFFNNWGGSQGVIYGGEGKLYNCSMWAGVFDGTFSRNYGGGTYLYNSLLMKYMESSSGGKLSGCVVQNGGGYFVTKTGFTKVEDSKCVDAENGDFRLFRDSVLLTAGATLPADWMMYYASSDINGKPFSFNSDGNTIVGSDQSPVARVTVAAPVSGTIEPDGVLALGEDDSITLAYTPDVPARNFLSFSVNGENVPGSAETMVLDGSAFADKAEFSVSAVFSTNWYVNASKPDDSGDGFTPDTAKRTLRAVMEDTAILSGDTVHAAPGRYDEGLMATPGFDGTTSNRVAIASGITLVADEGPELTTIAGAPSPRPHDNDTYGRGVGAVRAVYMAKYSRLKGFTVTEGRSDNSVADDNLYSSGGGIYAAGGAEGVIGEVENCTIRGNYGVRGGGSYAGKFINCRFGNNVSNGAQGEDCRIAYLYGCIFDQSFNNRNVMAPMCVVNCTFGPNTCVYGGAVTYKGCLFLSVTAKENIVSAGSVLENCAYVLGGSLATMIVEGKVTTSGCFAGNDAAALGVDENYVPVRGSVLIDNGPAQFGMSTFAGLDNRASQRVYNGRLDIGACEYDWRRDYCARLGCGGAKMTYVSPEVEDAESYLSIPSGARIDFAWGATRKGTGKFTADVSGDGMLSMDLDGARACEIAAVDGIVDFKFMLNGGNLQSFAFEGEGEGRLRSLGLGGLRIIIR